jgi:hypothetical protein
MGDLFTPIFDEMSIQAYEETDAVYPMLFRELEDNSKEYKTSWISDLAPFQKVNEAQELPQDVLRPGYDKTFTHDKYGKALQFSYEYIDDIESRYSDVQSRIAAIQNDASGDVLGAGRMVRYTVDDLASEIFQQAFTSTTYSWGGSTLGPDGVVLCSNSHPINPDQPGTVLDNLATAAFAEGALEAMLIQIAKQGKNARNQLVDINPTILLYPPDVQFDVTRLLESTNRVKTANNDINVHRATLTPVMWKRLDTDTNDWFLVDPTIGLKIIWRKRPSWRYVNDPKNETHNFYMSFRLSLGFDDWRGVWGSNVT